MAGHSQFQLLRERRFAPFFATQFLGAFNDNVYKNALVILLAFQGADYTRLDPNILVNLAAGLFILPFFLFSATAGQLADRYDKARIMQWIKGMEIAIMALAGLGFALKSFSLLMAALFLMGTHSTFFGPAKYAILPQHLREDELLGGNGLVEMGTFAAILLGTLLAGLLTVSGNTLWVTAVSLTIAGLGFLSSRWIPPAPAANPTLVIGWNLVTETARCLRFAWHDPALFPALLGISWFWFYGAIVLSQFPNLAKSVIHGGEPVVTVLLTLFSVGVGIGSMMCERLSHHNIDRGLGLVPFGCLGMSLFTLDFFLAAPLTPAPETLGAWAFLASGGWRLGLDLAGLGFSGGIFIVPLYTLIQARSEVSHRSRVIAANNILNALFMVVSAIFAVLLLGSGLSIPGLYLLTAFLNLLAGALLCWMAPVFLDTARRWWRG
ncbi:MAG: MFS transporter [Pseudomonadota bacterium]